MGRTGGQHHLKRMAAPAKWPIHRKEYQWVVRPRPGPHKLKQCLPLLLIVRDILNLVKTRREAKYVLSKGYVMIDGKVRREDDFPVGFMDVVEIPLLKTAFRVLPGPKKKIILNPIGGEEIEFKLCQIMNKTCLKGGHLQLNLSDGRNILIPVEDPLNPKEDVYKTYDVLKIKVPENEVQDHLKLEVGALAIVTGGKSIGRWGEVIDVERREGVYKTTLTLKDEAGESFKTIIDYIFPIGKGMPWISMAREDDL